MQGKAADVEKDEESRIGSIRKDERWGGIWNPNREEIPRSHILYLLEDSLGAVRLTRPGASVIGPGSSSNSYSKMQYEHTSGTPYFNEDTHRNNTIGIPT